MSKKLYAELFEPMRALGSFASKITMAYALRIVTKEIYNDLERVRRLRNAFAHASEVLNFESESIAPLLQHLNKAAATHAITSQEQFLKCIEPIDEALQAYLKSKGVVAP